MRTYILATVMFFLALPILAVFWLTQPILPVNSELGLAPTSLDLGRHAHAIDFLSPRSSEHPENLDDVALYIAREWERVGIPVYRQEFEVNGRTYQNVIATFGPPDGPMVVVGAHYDAFGEFSGGDDNASGVSGLIELGKLLRLHPPKGPVELVAYTLEEPPHFATVDMGSVAHVKQLQAAGVEVKAMLSLEMIGYFDEAEGSQTYPNVLLKWLYPSRGNFIAVVGDLAQGNLVRNVKRSMAAASGGLPVRSINAPSWIEGVDFSDHRSYAQAGFPSLMITDTAFYRNKAYHTAEDRPDRLNFRVMSQVMAGVFRAVQDLADGTGTSGTAGNSASSK